MDKKFYRSIIRLETIDFSSETVDAIIVNWKSDVAVPIPVSLFSEDLKQSMINDNNSYVIGWVTINVDNVEDIVIKDLEKAANPNNLTLEMFT